jgi:hypothetical protein
LRSHFLAVVGRQTFPDDLVVIGEHLRVYVFADPPNKVGRTFDVGEEECEYFDR